ncbi:MAG: hypothetical protein FIB07_11620 [Candidatus Methanoperedens sp.]|nr:hypothetical protein [Candidatus Methanoperedens sp.]
MKIKIQGAIMLSIFLISAIGPARADEGMASDIICPCECAMVISTCDCSTAIQVKKEIAQMKDKGFSEKQIFSALQAEYGTEILVHPEKTISSSLVVAGVSLAILFVFLGYIFSKKTRIDIIPDIKKYEQQFEEEYRNFVSEIEDSDKNVNHIPEDTPIQEDKW